MSDDLRLIEEELRGLLVAAADGTLHDPECVGVYGYPCRERLCGPPREALAAVQRVRERLTRIEDFCESHLPFASEKSEVVARRVLWAIRGSNEDPPHPDRLEGASDA